MKKLSLLLGVIMFTSFIGFGQNTSLFKVSQVSVQPFGSYGNIVKLNAGDISSLTNGQLSLTDAALDEYGLYSYGGSYIGGGYYYGTGFTNAGININLGLQIRNDDSFSNNRLLRVGFQAGSFAYGSASTSNKSNTRVDTLSSTAGSDPVFVDSINENSLDITKAADLISLDVSLIYQTNQEKQFSLYGGGGINFGLSLNSYTQVVTSDNSYYDISGKYDDDSFTFANSSRDLTRYDNDLTVMANLYLPIGAKMRLGNHNEFLKRFHAFVEYRPSLFFLHAPELGTSASFANHFGAGLSMQF